MNQTQMAQQPGEERSVLDILLDGTARNVQTQRPSARYRVRRLSKDMGCEVVFTLKALQYDRAVALGTSATMDMDTVLEGVTEPNLRDVKLAVKYGILKDGQTWSDSAATPPDLVKAILLPGEIASLARAVQQLSGYQVVTVQEVKKN